MTNGKLLKTLSFKGLYMRKTPGVIMLMGAHFLSSLLQSEAYTGRLIFQVRDRQNKDACRVSVKPVVFGACVYNCVCSHVFIHLPLSACVCVCIFYHGLIQVPPDAAAICSPANQRLQQNASSSESWFTGSLHLTCVSQLVDVQWALPPKQRHHTKGRFSHR